MKSKFSAHIVGGTLVMNTNLRNKNQSLKQLDIYRVVVSLWCRIPEIYFNTLFHSGRTIFKDAVKEIFKIRIGLFLSFQILSHKNTSSRSGISLLLNLSLNGMRIVISIFEVLRRGLSKYQSFVSLYWHQNSSAWVMNALATRIARII